MNKSLLGGLVGLSLLTTSPLMSQNNTNLLEAERYLLARVQNVFDNECSITIGSNYYTPEFPNSLDTRRSLGLTINNPQQLPEITIAKRFVNEIAFIWDRRTMKTHINDTAIGATSEKPIIITCQLNAKYKQLNLSFGLEDRSASDKDIIRLAIFEDTNMVFNQAIKKGTLYSTKVDVSNSQQVSFSSFCESSYICPRLSFTEMSLH